MDSYTRTEQYLNGILNGTDVPEPYTREEQLLYDIAKNGGGGGGGASDLLVNFTIDAENTVSTETSISSIMTAINNGTNVRCKVAKEDNSYYAMGKIDGYVNVEEEETSATYLFFSFYEWDGESNPTPYMLSAIMGANEGEDDVWYYVPCDLNNADTSSY